MSSRTSSRSTLTMVPSTMSPSLKYLMVASMAARKSSSDPMSLTATCGASERVGVIVIRELVPQDGWSCADAREARFHYQWVPSNCTAALRADDRCDHRRDSEREPATSETPADSCA